MNGAQYDGLSFQEARAIIMILSPEERLNWYGYRAGWADWKQLKECVELVTFSSLSHSAAAYEPPPCPVFQTKRRRESFTADEDIDRNRPDTVTENLTESQIARASGEEEDGTKTHLLPQYTATNIAQAAEKPPEEPKKVVKEPEEFQDDIRELAKRETNPMAINAKSKEEMLENMRRFRRYHLRLHVEVIANMKRFASHTKDISLGGIALEDPIPDWVAGYCTVIISTLDLKHRLEFMCSVVENQEGERLRLEIYPSSDSGELREWLEQGLPGEKAS